MNHPLKLKVAISLCCLKIMIGLSTMQISTIKIRLVSKKPLWPLVSLVLLKGPSQKMQQSMCFFEQNAMVIVADLQYEIMLQQETVENLDYFKYCSLGYVCDQGPIWPMYVDIFVYP